jgi:hypothetical protein
MQIDPVALSAKSKLDALMDQAFAVRALAGADLIEQCDGAFFEKAGPDAAKYIVRRLTLQDDVVDAASMQQLAEQKAGRPRADDGYFRPQRPFSPMASACDPQSSYASTTATYNV